MTETVTAEVDVDAPVRAVYDQWTQLEDLPRFLHAVESVEQVDDVLTHWVVSVGGVHREFDATIIDQVPDDHVSWASADSGLHAGRVSFSPLSEGRTHVELQMQWEPERLVEKAGAALNLDERQAQMDLERFKDFMEKAGMERGGWRGEIHGAEVTDTSFPSTEA